MRISDWSSDVCSSDLLYETVVDGETVRVAEAIEARKPFGQLKHFKHKGTKDAPKLLIVAPMSGHYATLLRGTVERMLPGHDVWVTDWRDARNVPLERSEEHTSELQSLMRISYAVFCLKKHNKLRHHT